MKKETAKLLVMVLALSVVATGLFALSLGVVTLDPTPQALPSVSKIEEVPQELPPEEPVIPLPPQPSRVRFMAAGDNLIHDNIYKQASARTGQSGFDFAPAYENVIKIFEGADLSFINQETLIAESLYPLSGYPRFNSPEALGNYVEEMGFDIIGMANNHMFDMNEDGLVAAMDFWESKKDLLSIGAWRNEADMQKPRLIEKDGIVFGFVAVTEHTNGLSLPVNSELRYIRSNEYNLMEEQVKLTKEYADFVVVSIHWGTESSVDVNSNQLTLAKMFADWGVDLVLGHHSHTLQPMEWCVGEQGNKTLVVYSLGNFISSMLYPQHMLGGVLDLEILKNNETGETTIEKATMIPVVTQYDGAGRSNVRTYPFSEYTNELAAKHGARGSYDFFGIPYFKGIIKKNIPQEFLGDLVLE